MKKLLVTGANGFVGTALLQELSNNHVQIIAVVKDISSDISYIKEIKNIQIVYCNMKNITNLPEIIPDRDIDACIHLAWDGSFGDKRADYERQLINVRYALDTVDTISRMGIKRFVGAGTLAEKDVLNYHLEQGSTPNPVSQYGVAKVATHLMTKVECTKLGIDHIWCYLSNTYGVGNKTNNFVNFAISKMLSGERASFTSGEQIYDFVYITDTVRGIVDATFKGRKNTAYYIGSTKARPLKEYIRIIRDTIDKNIELFLGEVPFKGKALPLEAYDCLELTRDTGYVPEICFEDGIIKTVNWLKTCGLVRKNNDAEI